MATDEEDYQRPPEKEIWRRRCGQPDTSRGLEQSSTWALFSDPM